MLPRAPIFNSSFLIAFYVKQKAERGGEVAAKKAGQPARVTESPPSVFIGSKKFPNRVLLR